MPDDPTTLILMYFVLPLWIAAGFADWLCHRAARIELTSGTKESVLHLVQFGEIGIALLAGLFLHINAGLIALMILVFLVHELTAWWDVSYAVGARKVPPAEQHVHSFLEMLPLVALVCVVSLYWAQFQSLVGIGGADPDFALRWKEQPLPTGYLMAVLGAAAALVVIPFIEELVRCVRADRRS